MSSAARKTQIKSLQAKIKSFKEAKQQADNLVAQGSFASEGFKKMSKDFGEKIEYAENFLDTLTTVSDLVDGFSSGQMPAAVADVVDAFLEKHANWEGNLLDTGNKRLSIGPFFGFLNVVVSFWASLKAEMKARRKKLGIKATAKVDGSARVGIGLSLGFSIPVVGNVSIGGGIEGGPDLDGRASFIMAVEGRNLKAIMNPASLDIDMAASIYLDIPSAVPDFVIEYIPELISRLKVRGKRVLYPLGSINVLEMRTPMYALTFDMRRGRFSSVKRTGGYTVDLNPVVKRKIKQVKVAIYRAADRFVDSLNPLNWDLNPFD